MRISWRKIIIWLVVLVIIGAIAYRSRGMLHSQDFSWAKLKGAVHQAKLSYLLGSLAGMYVAYFIRAIRWKRFSRYLGPSNLIGIYRATLIGFSSVFLLGRAGEPVRPLLIAKKENFPAAAMFGTYLLERLFDTAATAAFLGVTLIVFPKMLTSAGADSDTISHLQFAGISLVVLIVLAAAFLVYFRFHGASALERRLGGWRGREGWRAKFAAGFSGFSQGLQAIRSFSDLAEALVYTAVHWGLMIFVFYWVSHAFGGDLGDITFPGAMFVLAFTMIGSFLQLPGVGGGSQVASFLAFSYGLGIDNEPSAAAAIVLWLITFAGVSLVGIPLLIHEGWSMGELRQLARAEAQAEATGTHLPATQVPDLASNAPKHEKPKGKDAPK
jgi:uncharacterized protein (TIRG00374 family)